MGFFDFLFGDSKNTREDEDISPERKPKIRKAKDETIFIPTKKPNQVVIYHPDDDIPSVGHPKTSPHYKSGRKNKEYSFISGPFCWRSFA
jgi:hypothetical protein